MFVNFTAWSSVMQRCSFFFSALLCCLTLFFFSSLPALALDEFEYRDDYSPWSMRARLGLVSPNYEETYTPSNATDGNKDILTSAFLVEGDVSYQFSPRFSFAASLGYTSQEKEDISITAFSQTATDNSKFSFLPTTFMFRFHPAPYGKLNPYIGAGWAYILGFNTFTGAEVENGSGFAIQAGFDYWLDNQFFVNFDVKQITAEFDVNYNDAFNGQDVSATYTYDPLLISAGMGLRF